MGTTLKATEFVYLCEEMALRSLADDVPRPQRRVMWTILQLHYGDPAFHFELQPRPGHGRVELGLHFEGPAEENDRRAAVLAGDAARLMAELGEGWELEEWTASWRRLHRTFSFTALTHDLAAEVAPELAKALTVLHPYAAGRMAALAPAG